jgi:hypothetical protein
MSRAQDLRNGDDIMAVTVANVTPERREPDSPRR